MTIDPRSFSIQVGSTEPIYRQLVDQIRRLVASGQLTSGDLVPSVREMAAALAINPMTISKAYSQLRSEGLLSQRRGLGMAVASPEAGARTLAARLELLKPTLERAVYESTQLELPPDMVIAALKRMMKGAR
jgi:GntR family transcriptional regulator